jgi:hypothetical protein
LAIYSSNIPPLHKLASRYYCTKSAKIQQMPAQDKSRNRKPFTPLDNPRRLSGALPSREGMKEEGRRGVTVMKSQQKSF